MGDRLFYGIINNGTGGNTFGCYGIYVTAGSGYNFYFNSINMSGDRDAVSATKPTAISAAIMVNSGSVLDIRNNIFVNTQTAATNAPRAGSIFNFYYAHLWIHYAVRKSSLLVDTDIELKRNFESWFFICKQLSVKKSTAANKPFAAIGAESWSIISSALFSFSFGGKFAAHLLFVTCTFASLLG